MNERNYTTARIIAPGTSVPPGDGVMIACSLEGLLNLIMSDGSILPVYVFPGTTTIDDISVRGVQVAGTSAVAIVSAIA